MLCKMWKFVFAHWMEGDCDCGRAILTGPSHCLVGSVVAVIVVWGISYKHCVFNRVDDDTYCVKVKRNQSHEIINYEI